MYQEHIKVKINLCPKKKTKKQKIVKDSYGLLCKIVVRNDAVKVVGLN